MKTQHTPGPWAAKMGHVTITIHDLQHEEPLDERNEIARLANSNPKSEADARLIAAAPDMLAALRYYATDTSINGETARAAIAKATGED